MLGKKMCRLNALLILICMLFVFVTPLSANSITPDGNLPYFSPEQSKLMTPVSKYDTEVTKMFNAQGLRHNDISKVYEVDFSKARNHDEVYRLFDIKEKVLEKDEKLIQENLWIIIPNKTYTSTLSSNNWIIVLDPYNILTDPVNLASNTAMGIALEMVLNYSISAVTTYSWIASPILNLISDNFSATVSSSDILEQRYHKGMTDKYVQIWDAPSGQYMSCSKATRLSVNNKLSIYALDFHGNPVEKHEEERTYYESPNYNNHSYLIQKANEEYDLNMGMGMWIDGHLVSVSS